MLKYGEVNPLNVFGLRRLGHCPPHFERFYFDLVVREKIIIDWVYENLTGRFWFDPLGLAKNQYCIAFEIASEASHFSLMLDQINNLDNYTFY